MFTMTQYSHPIPMNPIFTHACSHITHSTHTIPIIHIIHAWSHMAYRTYMLIWHTQ